MTLGILSGTFTSIICFSGWISLISNAFISWKRLINRIKNNSKSHKMNSKGKKKKQKKKKKYNSRKLKMVKTNRKSNNWWLLGGDFLFQNCYVDSILWYAEKWLACVCMKSWNQELLRLRNKLISKISWKRYRKKWRKSMEMCFSTELNFTRTNLQECIRDFMMNNSFTLVPKISHFS